MVVAAVAAGLPLVTIANVQGADTKDVYQEVFNNQNTLRTPMAQTFTPQKSGGIDRVTLRIATSGPVSLTVQIQDTSGGKPNGYVRGTSSFAGTLNAATWQDFPFSSPASVVAGTLYAIVVTPAGTLTWYDLYTINSPQPGVGQMWLLVNGTWQYQTAYGYDFAFDEWQGSGTTPPPNRPPVLLQTNGTLVAPEGTTATNSGTYSDPDNDNVALSASAGSLTKTGTSNGNWSWSLAGADEAPAQTVTITATDGRGGTNTVSFRVTFAPVAPTVTITGAPASGPEGTLIKLTGSAKNAANQDDGFTFKWSVSKDAKLDWVTGAGTTFSFAPDDEGTFVVSLTATDDGGNAATVMATITGDNVKPTATITKISWDGLILVAGTPVTFEGGFTDPGKLDTHTAYWNFGDGSPESAALYDASGAGDTTVTYPFTKPGTYTVEYEVKDDDGGSSTATAQVKVLSPAQALGVIENYVSTMSSLTQGEKNSLIAKYRAAENSAGRGDTNATCGQLGAVLNDLSALVGNGRLSATDASTLSSATWATHRALGCTKVKLSWLNLTL